MLIHILGKLENGRFDIINASNHFLTLPIPLLNSWGWQAQGHMSSIRTNLPGQLCEFLVNHIAGANPSLQSLIFTCILLWRFILLFFRPG